MDPHVTQGSSGQIQGAHHAHTRNCWIRQNEQQAKDLEIYIPPGPRLGHLVIQAKGLTKGYGDKLLVENMEFSLPPGGIVGIIGPNGAGKTTLFRMITGQDHPDSGSIRYRRDGEAGLC